MDVARELAGVVLVGRRRWVELLAAGNQTNIEQVHVEIYSHGVSNLLGSGLDHFGINGELTLLYADVFLKEPALYSYFVVDANQHRALETISSSLSLLEVLQILLHQQSWVLYGYTCQVVV